MARVRKRHVGVTPTVMVTSLKQAELSWTGLLSWIVPFSDTYVNLIHVSVLIIGTLMVIYFVIVLVSVRLSYVRLKERRANGSAQNGRIRGKICAEHRRLYRPEMVSDLNEIHFDPPWVWF